MGDTPGRDHGGFCPPQQNRELAPWRLELSDRASPLPQDLPRQLPSHLPIGRADLSRFWLEIQGARLFPRRTGFTLSLAEETGL